MPSSEARSQRLSSTAPRRRRTLTVGAYSGIFEENYRPAVVGPFMKANPGIKVVYYPLGSSAQTLQVLRAQKAARLDVVLFDVSVARAPMTGCWKTSPT